MSVVVTGSAGYIGGQIALELQDQGHEVHGVDRREPPEHLRGVVKQFLFNDFASDRALSWLVRLKPTAIIHCAGTSLVGPSMTNPAEYYNNNVAKTLKLLDTVRTELPGTRFIFSSSAATYGVPQASLPCNEQQPTAPISPYGESKLMVEKFLQGYRRAYGLDYVAFRYFNACGADPQARHGQEPGATHIIARVLESIRDNRAFTLYGTDYPTDDGTCVRDYVHVDDIARAHVMALDSKIPVGIYNLGSNAGTSNRAIIAEAETATGKTVQVEVGSQRAGDPAVLVASADKFSALANWRQYDLADMVKHAWAWYVR